MSVPRDVLARKPKDDDPQIKIIPEIKQALSGIIPGRAARLSPTNRVVLAAMTAYAGKAGQMFWSQKRLASELDFGIRTIKQAYRELQDHGCIQVRRQGRSRAAIVLLPWSPEWSSEVQTSTPQHTPEVQDVAPQDNLDSGGRGADSCRVEVRNNAPQKGVSPYILKDDSKKTNVRTDAITKEAEWEESKSSPATPGSDLDLSRKDQEQEFVIQQTARINGIPPFSAADSPALAPPITAPAAPGTNQSDADTSPAESPEADKLPAVPLVTPEAVQRLQDALEEIGGLPFLGGDNDPLPRELLSFVVTNGATVDDAIRFADLQRQYGRRQAQSPAVWRPIYQKSFAGWLKSERRRSLRIAPAPMSAASASLDIDENYSAYVKSIEEQAAAGITDAQIDAVLPDMKREYPRMSEEQQRETAKTWLIKEAKKRVQLTKEQWASRQGAQVAA